MLRLEGLMKDTNTQTNSKHFCEQMARDDDTWKLWMQFVFTDCYSYLALYLAIRGGNWKLRLSSLK